MTPPATDPAANLTRYLEAQSRKTLLRFITCGSVDDGKSTLIGRLLFDTRQIFDDQLSALESDSARVGTDNLFTTWLHGRDPAVQETPIGGYQFAGDSIILLPDRKSVV